jgi:hypothetical protein
MGALIQVQPPKNPKKGKALARRVRLDGPVPSGQISMNETIAIGGKAEISRLMKAAAALGSPDRYAGKRKKSRFTAALHLDLCFDPAGDEAAQPITMHQISEGGISFWLRTKLPDGHTLYVRDSSENPIRPWLKAQVIHCAAGMRGILIGCAFKPAN